MGLTRPLDLSTWMLETALHLSHDYKSGPPSTGLGCDDHGRIARGLALMFLPDPPASFFQRRTEIANAQ